MLAVLFAWLAAVAWFDFRQRRVPNWLAATGLLFALLALFTGRGLFGLSVSSALLGFAAGAALIVFHVARLMGAGDVKFAAALGLWIGWQGLAIAWVAASLLAAVHAAWVLSIRPGASSPAERRRRTLPYAALMALACAAWLGWRLFAS